MTAADTLAAQAAMLLVLDPPGFAGIRLRAAAGPARDAWLADLRARLAPGTPWHRLPISISDDRLLGGLDLAASLARGQAVLQRGLLAQCHGGVLLVPMAERLPLRVLTALSATLDHGELAIEREGHSAREPARLCIVALDEAVVDEPGVAAMLTDRLAFDVDLATASAQAAPVGPEPSPADRGALLARAQGVEVAPALLEALCAAAAALGVDSARGVLFALRALRLCAALRGRRVAREADLDLAMALVLGPRATRWPAPPAGEQDAAPPAPAPPPYLPADSPPGPDHEHDHEHDHDKGATPAEPEPPTEQAQAERLVAAALAALPPGVLAALSAGARAPRRAGTDGRSGARASGGRRGAPVGLRAGLPRGGERLSLVDTLRAAAPWQRLRGAVPGAGERVRVLRDDLRVQRRARPLGTTTVFLVDASGSTALHRLAETKGAVELMLAESYVSRSEVAVISFRGSAAQVLLPPSRSLVRAKRSLAGLPGGGGTPLAAALDAARAMVTQLQRRGSTPQIVLLTDGRANVARDPAAGKAQAALDAAQAARELAASGTRTLVIDTSPRPSPAAAQLALTLQARYLPLPHLQAETLSAAVAGRRPARR